MFKRDVQENFSRFFDRLPNGPNLRAAEQVSEVMGMLDMPLISRASTTPGLAPDPVWGNGIGWAFQAAEWLVEYTAEALREGRPAAVDQALQQYRRKHHAAFAGRFARDADFAKARPFNIFERLMYSAAVRDPKMARYTGPHTTHLANIRHFPPLKAILRALWVNLTYRKQASGPRPGRQRQLLTK